MKTLFITSFHPHISRNILSTDFLKILKTQNQLRLVIVVPDYKADYFRTNFGADNVIVEGVVPNLVSKTKAGLFFKRLGFFLFDTKTARSKKRYEYLCQRKYLIYIFAQFMGFLSRSFLIRRLTRYLDYYFSPKGLFDNLFDKYRPEAIFSTDIQNENDLGLLFEARRRKMLILGMLRSWDNATQRILRILPDKFFVGSQTLKEEVINLYRYPEEKIIITGNPHYDRYLKGPSISKEQFFNKFGLDSRRKMILYAPLGNYLLRHNDVDQYIMEMLGKIDAQILVRFPPDESVTLNNFVKPANMAYDQPGVIFNNKRFGDREISLDDDQRLIDAIYWCNLAITGPTSICLDAALLDKPVIAVNFSPKPRNFCESILGYHCDHIKKLLGSGGVFCATDKGDFLKAVEEYLKNSEKDKEGRAKIRSLWFSHADGRSAERLAQEIINAVKS